MSKPVTITVRVEEQLKRRLEARAKREHRSLSAQVEHELTMALQNDPPGHDSAKPTPFLGRYEGTRVPEEKDFQDARDLLWSRLQRSI